MRKVLFTILFVLLATTVFALNWGDTYWTVQPSSLPDSYIEGDSFKTYFTDRRWPNIKYEVYVDVSFAWTNGEWVYVQWRQDHGWYLDRNQWWSRNNSAQSPIRGALYIDPYEKVAIYFYPYREGGFDVYRVRVLNK